MGVAAAALVVASLSACGAGDDAQAGAQAEPDARGADAPRLVQGGEPGDAATEVPSDSSVPPNEWTHADEMFMQMMIPHHAQALEMSELARARADDRRVKLLAERIRAGQGPEIQMMAAWLEDRELRVPEASDDAAEFDHGQHGHSEMAGMLTRTQLEELADARGRSFDRLFLERMIGHHEGALQMVSDTAADGLDVVAGETRNDIASSQSAEIARMRGILADL